MPKPSAFNHVFNPNARQPKLAAAVDEHEGEIDTGTAHAPAVAVAPPAPIPAAPVPAPAPAPIPVAPVPPPAPAPLAAAPVHKADAQGSIHIDVQAAPVQVVFQSLLMQGGEIEMRIPSTNGGPDRLAYLRYIPPHT